MFDSMVSSDLLAASLPAGALPPSSGLRQHTLKSPISCVGVGLHSGARVTMVLQPAPENSGIRFRRTDIAGGGAEVPALWSQVRDTRLNTCLADEAGNQVRTVEHLMAALAGMAIDNCAIDINGPEVPAMDGSAAPFLFLMECAGVIEQDAPRRAIEIRKRVTVQDGDRVASLMPGAGCSVEVVIDFPADAIRRQAMHLSLTGGAFKNEISRARSFGFEQDVAQMRAAGLALGGSLDNAVVISSDGRSVLNEDGLRYEDEFVRHKILDAVGDLYLMGAPLIGHFQGVRCGHAINNQLLRALFADASAWEMVTLRPADLRPAASGYSSRMVAAAPA